MIEKNITNIDRGITQQKVDDLWKSQQSYVDKQLSTSSYAYKKIPNENIRYDNTYTLNIDTWAAFSSGSISGKIFNMCTSSISDFDKSTLLNIYAVPSHTGSSYLELFQIGYANKNGSGSLYGAQEVNIYGDLEYIKKEQTKTLYRQIKKLFTKEGESLSIDGVEINDFVFLSIRNQYLFDGIQPETFELHMSKLDASAFPIIDIEGPAVPSILIDKKIQGTSYGYILSGSLADGPYKINNQFEKKYGFIDYSTGTIIISADRMVIDLGFSRGTTEILPNEDWKMPEQTFLSIYAAIFGTIPGSGITNTPIGSTFSLKSVQNVNYALYQCELDKQEFNYSNNITYRDTKTNTFKVKKFVSASNYDPNVFQGLSGSFYSSSNSSTYQNPEAFVTTIGLYSDTYDLIAVAKLSKPIRKNYDKKIIINVRLDY